VGKPRKVLSDGRFLGFPPHRGRKITPQQSKNWSVYSKRKFDFNTLEGDLDEGLPTVSSVRGRKIVFDLILDDGTRVKGIIKEYQGEPCWWVLGHVVSMPVIVMKVAAWRHTTDVL
jgi:hypothetical protein